MNYPFYRILLFMMLGIVTAYYYDIAWEHAAAGMFICLLCIALIQGLRGSYRKFKWMFGSASLLFFFLLGVFSFQIQSDLAENHFTRLDVLGKNSLISLELTDQLAPNQYNTRFYADVLSVDDHASSGRLLVLFKRSDSITYSIGDRLLVYDDINDASDARNPGDFNYKEYLKSIDVYGQLYIDKTSVIEVSRDTDRVPFLVRIKQEILNRLAQSGLNSGPRSMVEALVLGQRQNVDPEITRSFRDAGVIHILALSGLHVGIILLILQFLTQRMTRWKYGRWLQSVLIIVLLWCFALLTGMSPSIMRAVTMFSFVAVGMNIKRKASTFHSLTLSAFFLLLVDARLLFQVGFQLSYMAVFAIVLLQPVIKNLWTWHHPVKNFFWNILTVTLAAQIGVAPLSIFYFHQLPGLFLLGNMMLLPVLPLIIGAALLLIALLLVGWPHVWLVQVLNWVLEFIIKTVERISSYDQFIIKDVYIDLSELVLFYVILFTTAFFIQPFLVRSKRERHLHIKPNWWLHMSLGAMIVLFGFKTYQEFVSQPNQLFILHQARGSALSYSNPDQVLLQTDLSAMDADRKSTSLSRLKSIAVHRDKIIKHQQLGNIITIEELQMMRIDSTGIWTADLKNAVVWLSGAPKINLDRIIKDTQPKAIISDGSNYRSSVDEWQKTCAELNIPFYNTYEDGAIDVLKL